MVGAHGHAPEKAAPMVGAHGHAPASAFPPPRGCASVTLASAPPGLHGRISMRPYTPADDLRATKKALAGPMAFAIHLRNTGLPTGYHETA